MKILEYFVKNYTRTWSVEVFPIKKVKNIVVCTYEVEDFNS